MTNQSKKDLNINDLQINYVQKLLKRKWYLTKKYQHQLAEELPISVREELKLIEQLIANAGVPESVYQTQPKIISIKNSRDEEWYFQQMKRWIEQHPESVNGQLGRSTIYKFALHFFVETILLNSQNSGLNLNELKQKIAHLSKTQDEAKLMAQNKSIEDSLSYLMAMTYKLLDHIPENLKKEKIEYQFNPMSPIELESIGLETDLTPDSELNLSFSAFKKIRSHDKERIKQVHQKRNLFHN